MYSSMAVLKDGRVAILYEHEGTLTLGRFSLSWLGEWWVGGDFGLRAYPRTVY